MSESQLNNLRSKKASSSHEDHTSDSDLRKLTEKLYGDLMLTVEKKFGDLMLTVEKKFGDLMPTVEEIRGRVIKLEYDMERLLIGTQSKMTHISKPRCLKLIFRNKISLPVLTGQKIKGEGGKYLEVALVDDVTGKVVDLGPEAFASLEIVALEGHSDQCDRDTWIPGNYKNRTVSVSEERKSVLVGQVKPKLNKGIGYLVDVKFKNSSNHNSGMFKLGANVIDSFDGTLIKEAMTESFLVKDYREKYKQKRYPPSLSDEIWRLKNIQKGGAIYDRVKEKAKTVEDFLIQLLKDPEGLRCLLHLPEKKWKDTVSHAQKCTINQKVYCSFNSLENKGVAFNIVGKILGLIKDQNYVKCDMLSQKDEVEARKLLHTAFNQKEGVKDFENEDSLLQYLSSQSTALSTNCPRPEKTVSHEVETSKIGESDHDNTHASSQGDSSSKHPNKDTICQDAGTTDADRTNFQDIFQSDIPMACTGYEAQQHGPICMDQSEHPNGGIISQEPEASVLHGIDLQHIFPSPSPNGGTTGLDDPVFSPYADQSENFDAFLQDASLLSWSPSKGEVSNDIKANGPHGFGLQNMEMGTNCFLSPDEPYPPLGPLWMNQYDDQSSSSFLIDKSSWLTQVHSGQAYSNNLMSSECGFIDCLRDGANRSWKVLLCVIKWFLKVKKAASVRNRLLKKQRIS